MPLARGVLASLACALLLGTAACSSPDGDEPPASDAAPSAAATDEPIFASDEEALAAAVEAYEAYADMSEQIASEGGTDPSRIEQVATADLAPYLIAEFEALRESGLRFVGENRISDAKLADRSETDQFARVSAYLCRDVGDVRILDSDGTDVTPEGDTVTAVLAHFVSSDRNSNALKLEDSEPWDDSSFCS